MEQHSFYKQGLAYGSINIKVRHGPSLTEYVIYTTLLKATRFGKEIIDIYPAVSVTLSGPPEIDNIMIIICDDLFILWDNKIMYENGTKQKIHIIKIFRYYFIDM